MMPGELREEARADVRVLLVDLSKRFGGASVRALTLAAHMKPGMVAIAGLKDSPVIKIAEERNISTRVVGKHRSDPLIPLRLRQVIRKEHFQVIDTQNIQSKFWGSLARFITDVALVATLNSSYQEEFGRGLKGKLYSIIDRVTNFRADRFIAVSDSIKQNLVEVGISGAMVDCVTNAVELDDSLQMDDPNVTRRQIGIPNNAYVCVSVGRLVWAKGHEDFIEAFATVADQIPNSYALILGNGALYPALTQKIKATGMDSRIMLLGHCEQRKVLRILKASNVFVMSSRSEGVPFALLEAAASGLPIVATRCGGIPEVIYDRVHALLVPVGDIQGIASGIMELYQNRPFAQELGSNAREKVLSEYGVSHMIEATRNSYQKAVEHKRELSNRRITSGFQGASF